LGAAALRTGAVLTGPLVGGLWAWSLLVQWALQGFALTVRWRWRWNPWETWRQLWSRATVVRTALAVAKLCAVVGVAGVSVWALRGAVGTWVWVPPAAWPGAWAAAWGGIFWRAAGAFAAVAIGDAVWQWRRFQRQLRMTTREVREELRQLEGDPRLRARRRQLRRQLLQRALSQIGQAAVVVTNPTHVAVALAWEFGQDGPPTVWMKGADELAWAIRAAAYAAGVPVVENPPLARALVTVPVGDPIPERHWRAVAVILAQIWRRRGGP